MNNKIICRTLTSLFACLMTGAMLIPAFAVNADTKIAINEKNFPDKIFRKYIKNRRDNDKDGYLSSEEIKRIDTIGLRNSGIKDFKGIEYLTNLEYLWVQDNELTTIDLSKNTKLQSIYIDNNKLKTLDLSHNTELSWLLCRGNLLETLDLSKNTKLEILCIDNNKIDKLDLSKNTDLEELRCEGNLLKTLDVSKNIYLSELFIDNNKLEKLDLSKNKELKYLHCGGNLFETLDLSKNNKLRDLFVENSKLKTIDLSKNTDIENLILPNNNFKKLDLSKHTNITCLNVGNNSLTSLDLSSANALQDLNCSNNAITSLDLTNCQGLLYLDCSNNAITSLSFDSYYGLYTLRCNNNKLTTLDLSDDTGVYELYCQNNQIDKLDLSGCDYLVCALSGDKTQMDGYTYYSGETDWGHHSELAVDDKTSVITDAITVDDKTKQMYLDQGAVVSLGFEGANDKTQVTLTSSDDSVVKIGTNNSLITRKAGTANITAKVGDKKYNFKVTVYYKDVKDNTKFWFEPTYALTDKGVVKGYDNQTKFKPANKCTRAQMVTFIWRLMGSPEPKNKDCSFPDVKKGDYFYKACIWGNENHIVEGYKDGTFGPQIVCARRHAVTFLWRLAGKPEPAGDKTKFSDVFKDIDEDDYFFKATIWATEQKIVAGYSDNTFRPNNDCLRRQMVTFLYKFDKYVGVKK